jgi:hypothetical protein
MLPVLRKQKDDGSGKLSNAQFEVQIYFCLSRRIEDEISEEELYRYTRYRWLYAPKFLSGEN